MKDQTRPTCVGCRHVLKVEEKDLGRIVCFECEQDVKKSLSDLAGPDGLFAQLVWLGADALIPGARRGNDPIVKTSKTEAPSPVRLAAMNLLGAGGVVHTLQRWVGTWYAELGFRQPVWRGVHHFVVMLAPGGVKVNRPGQLDNTAKVLVNNLPWACEHRTDFGEFRHDLRRFVEDARVAIDPTIAPRVHVQIGRCPARVDGLVCGRLLDADPFATGIYCPNCGTRWPREQWLALGQTIQSS